ncbi:unnamed protein product [Urochloa humidicola]
MGLTIMTINVLPFTDSLDITIIVAMARFDFCMPVTDIMKINQAYKLSLSRVELLIKYNINCCIMCLVRFFPTMSPAQEAQ